MSPEKKTAKRFIRFLMQEGVIDEVKAATYLELWQVRYRFGIIALRESFISPDKLSEVLESQQAGQIDSTEKIGEIMIRLGYMTEEQVGIVLELQKQEDLVPAEVFAESGLIPFEVIQEKLEKFLALDDDDVED